MEQTFIMIKPDAVQRGLINRVIGRIEDKGYKLVAMKLIRLTPEMAARHYVEHEGKPFYEDLIAYITSGPVVAMVWAGKGVIGGIRSLMGVTNPLEADPGSIRGSFGQSVQYNLVHGSDSAYSAQREIGLYFSPAELLEYERNMEIWI